MKIKSEYLLIALFLFGVLAQASQAKTIDTFTPENVIEIISQTGIEANFNYSFKELNKTHWNASFCITNPLTVISPTSYNLTALTSNIEFEQGVSKVRFDSRTRCGWFYIIFPKGFMPDEKAEFGSNSTLIGTTTTVPWNQNERVICKDGSGRLHVAYSYDSVTIAYANSSDGSEWSINTSFSSGDGGGGLGRGKPSISCDGNNITITYEYNLVGIIAISTNNGVAWAFSQLPYTVNDDVLNERRGQNIYVVYANNSYGRPICFVNSSDGGSTWGSAKTLISSVGACAGTGTTSCSGLGGTACQANACCSWNPKTSTCSIKACISLTQPVCSTCGGCTWVISNMQYPTMAVNGTGTSTDWIYVAAYDSKTSEKSVYFVNSTNGGTSFGGKILAMANNYGYNSQITFNNSDVMIVGYDVTFQHVYFTNSSDAAHTTWAAVTQLDTGGQAIRASITLNSTGYPIVFFENITSNSSNEQIVYTYYNGTAWVSPINVTANATHNTNVQTAYMYYSDNKIHYVWYNYSYPNTAQILYDFINLPAGGQPPALDIGDPLYCSVSPIVGVGISPVVLCMPKSNVTSQPLTGLTINCQTQLATGAYTGGIQASSAMTEQTNGLYNYTIKNTSLSANTLYTVNCTTAITGVNNNFGAVFYVMPDFATNITSVNTSVNNLGINISDLNTTLIALGVNTSNIYDVLIALGINSSTINETCNLGFANTTENFTNIESLINALNDVSAQDIWEYVLRDANCSNCTGEGSNTTYNNSYYSSIYLTPDQLQNISKYVWTKYDQYQNQSFLAQKQAEALNMMILLICTIQGVSLVVIYQIIKRYRK